MATATKGTPHEGITTQYLFRKLREKKVETLKPSKKRKIEDIRSQWVNYEKCNQWFTDQKSVLIDTQFAEDQTVINTDCTVEELYITPVKRRQIVIFDETDHPLNDDDN